MNFQKQRLKDHLASGKHITRLSALTELGIFELSARIKDLESEGITVNRKWVKVTNRFNEVIRCKEYRLQPYEDAKITKQIETLEQFKPALKYIWDSLNKLKLNQCKCEIVMGDFSYLCTITSKIIDLKEFNRLYADFEQSYLDYILKV